MVIMMTRRDQSAVRGGCLVFLIMIALFAPLQVNIFGVPTNISIIPGSAYTSCIVMLTINHGFKYAMKVALLIAQWLLYMQFCIYFMSVIIPNPLQSNEFNLIAKVITQHTFHTFTAAYVSIILSIGIIAVVANWLEKWPPFYVYVAANFAAYTFGGVAFYTLVFTGDPQVFKQVVTSIPLKFLMTVIYYPVVSYMNSSINTSAFGTLAEQHLEES